MRQSTQARKGKVLLGLKCLRTRGAPIRHPRFHPGPGSPKLTGLTSRIEGKPPQVARVSLVSMTTPHPELIQEDTLSYQIWNVNLKRHPISWQPGHPQRPTGIWCSQGTRHTGQQSGVIRHRDTATQPGTCWETLQQRDTCVRGVQDLSHNHL